MRKVYPLTAAVVLLALVSGCEKAVDVEPVVIDGMVIEDFSAGMPPNYLGGDYGAWDSAPEDPTQGAETYFDNQVRVRDEGYSLRIEYDVDSDNPAFNGVWMKLMGENFEPYDDFVFSVKGDSDDGFTTRVRLELKNEEGQTGSYMLSGISDEWQEISIPLGGFRGLRDRSAMDEFVIVFQDEVVTEKTGTIYIDNISLR